MRAGFPKAPVSSHSVESNREENATNFKIESRDLKTAKIPFGPGHPDYDNQLDLFEDQIGEPVEIPSGAKTYRSDNLWFCPHHQRMVEAKDLITAKRKLGKGARPEPALIEYGGYCGSGSAKESERATALN
jgi:hypothetical protein